MIGSPGYIHRRARRRMYLRALLNVLLMVAGYLLCSILWLYLSLFL